MSLEDPSFLQGGGALGEQAEDPDRRRDAGCDGHLVKPVDFAFLRQVLR